MPTRLPLLAALLVVAGCDTQAPPPGEPVDPAAALLGTWTVTDVQYQEAFTLAVDAAVLARYEPAGAGVTVPALGAPALRYVVGAKRSGTACAAPPCLDLIELSNAPRTFDGVPTGLAPGETELLLRIDDDGAVLLVGPNGDDGIYGSAGPVGATRSATSITVPDLTLTGGGATVEVRGATLGVPTQAVAAGVETTAMPPVAVGDGFVGEMTVAFVEGGGARIERPFREPEVGTWTLDGDAVAVETPTWSLRGRLDGGLTLTRTETCAAPSSCTALFARIALLLPADAVSAVRFETTFALAKG